MNVWISDGVTPYLAGIVLIPWALLHSVFADSAIKVRLSKWIAPKVFQWYRLIYTILSVLSFGSILALRKLYPGSTIWLPEMWVRWILIGVQVLAGSAFLFSAMRFDAGSFLGYRLAKENDPDPILDDSGPYGIVRHPLYTLGIILIWASPEKSTGGLFFAVVLSLYLWLGTYHEENGLLEEFGDVYGEYTQRIPRLIPGLKFHRKD